MVRDEDAAVHPHAPQEGIHLRPGPEQDGVQERRRCRLVPGPADPGLVAERTQRAVEQQVALQAVAKGRQVIGAERETELPRLVERIGAADDHEGGRSLGILCRPGHPGVPRGEGVVHGDSVAQVKGKGTHPHSSPLMG